MSAKVSFFSLVLISILLVLSTSACAMRMIQGRVVDAVTGKSIENAAVHIAWFKSGSGPPGLAGSVQVEVAEDLSNTGGLFNIPKHSTIFKDFHMAVYKKGYVCWSSDDIFPSYEKRKNFRLKNGMVIKLERFKEKYSKERHAYFTIFSKVGISHYRIFDNAIKSEIELRRKIIRKEKSRRK